MNKIYFEVGDNVVIKRTPIPEIGENFYKTEIVMTKEIFQECYKKWVETPQKKAEAASYALAGETVVIAGTLPTLDRKEAEDFVRANGGKVTGSVSKKTTLLVAGEAAGSKLTRAQEFGIRIVSEEELRKMCASEDKE